MGTKRGVFSGNATVRRVAATSVVVTLACNLAQAQSAAPGVISALTTSPDATPSLVAPQRAALSLALGDRTQLIYEPSLWRPKDAPATALNRSDSDAHLALQFKSPRSSGPRNLLRVQLSGGGVMQFRPRGGGMTVRYQVQF